jgi:hypothetical protein
MREVTEAESRVITGLLGAGNDTERLRVRESGLPRSTYVVARRRLYTEGWLYDRFVPNPVRLGIPRVTFALARPFAESVTELTERWRGLEGTVVLWRQPETLFGVFLGGRKGPDEVSEGLTSTLRILRGDPRTGAVPVYFDFEGAWSEIAGGGTRQYPRALGGEVGGEVPDGHSPAFWEGIHGLLARTSPSVPPVAAAHRLRPMGLPRSQVRILANGYVEHRVLPDLTKLPPVGGARIERLALLMGSLLPGSDAKLLFQELVGSARVHPFLYAHAGGEVLLGAVAGARGTTVEGARPRTSVVETLRRHLRGVETFWMETENLRAVVDHDYLKVPLPSGRA